MKAADLESLGRRAVACKGWRWMPGMLARRHTPQGLDICRRHSETDVRPAPPADEYADLTDPATLGCLLHLVREAWPHEWHQFMVPIFDGISHWYMGCLMPGTSRIVMPTRVMQNGLLDALPPKPTEAEALVAALEAAP
jgi:hypothetical protein